MRSGTTFVGNVLAQSPDLFYLHEPFNPTWGIEGAEQWLPYVRDQRSPAARLVDQFFGLDFSYKSPVKETTLKGKIKSVVGGRTFWRGLFYRCVGQHFTGMLIKDPLAVLLSRYMYETHNTDVVALVRHPVAFYWSNKRLGWDFDLDNFREQPHLLEDHLQEEVSMLQKSWTYPERIALLWRCVNRVLCNFKGRLENEKTWVVKRHEDLCVQPIVEFNDIFDQLNISFSSLICDYIHKSTSRNNDTFAQYNETHQLQRDSGSLAYYWKQKVSGEERDNIRAIVEPVAERFYDDSTWRVEKTS